MSISIRAAWNHIKTEAYNKNNLKQYFILMFLVGIFCGFMDPKTFGFGIAAVAGLLYSFCMIPICGIAAYAINRYFKKEAVIFPGLLEEMSNIIFIAFKYIGGVIILSIIVAVLTGIIMFLTINIPVLCIISFFIWIFIMFFILSGLTVGFMSTLDFKEWFKFSKAFNIITSKFTTFCSYWWKNFLICLLTGIVAIPIIIIVGLLAGIFSHGNLAIISVLGSIVGSVLGAFVSIIGIDLSGQLLTQIYTPEIPESPDNQ